MTRVRLWRFLENERIYPVLVLAFAVAAVVAPSFTTSEGIRGLLNLASTNLIVVSGLTIVLLCGEIDLSVGSVVALSGMVAMGWQSRFGTLGAALAALLVGAIIGGVNGVLVTRFKIGSLLATLATMILVQGIALSVAHGRTVSGTDLQASLWIESPLWIFSPTSLIAIAVVLLLELVVWQTASGRAFYVIGGSGDKGRLSDIRTDRYLVIAFILSASCSALGGVLLSMGLLTGSPAFGASTLFAVVTAAVVGGTSLLGAQGSVLKSALGVMLLAVINTVFAFEGFPTYVLNIVTGVILLSVVLLDSYLGLRHRRGWNRRLIPDLTSTGVPTTGAS